MKSPLLGGVLSVDLPGQRQGADEPCQTAHAAEGFRGVIVSDLPLVGGVIGLSVGEFAVSGLEQLRVNTGVGIRQEVRLVVLQQVHKAIVAGGEQPVGQKAQVAAASAAVEAGVVIGSLLFGPDIGGEGGYLLVEPEILLFAVPPLQFPAVLHQLGKE